MGNILRTIIFIGVSFTWSAVLYSQSDPAITIIDDYCDSLDKARDIQTVTRAGPAVTLEYIFSGGEVIKIIGHPSGYRFISATETYYFRKDKPVFVNADIEISREDGGALTIEIHKIYIGNDRIIRHLESDQTFNPDSLYKNDPDPVKTAARIRKNAKFIPGQDDPGFEKILLHTIENYLKARSSKEGDPVFNDLYLPFI